MMMMSKIVLRGAVAVAAGAALFLAGVAVGQNKYNTPGTVIHLVALKWKPEAGDADKKKAIDGIKAMAAAIPGIKNIWIKPLRVQPREYNANFAIEFENEEAAKRYADHPAHKEWEKHYLSIREESRSQQVTN